MLRLRDGTRKSDKLLITHSNLHSTNQQVKYFTFWNTFGAKTSHKRFWTHKTHHGPRLRGSHHLPPYSILCASAWHLHPNGFLSRDSQGGISKLSRFGIPPLCGVIILFSDLWLGWGLKETCSFCRELSNGVLHSTFTHWGRVDSQLLVVGSQTINLTPILSFWHNLCCRCPNGSCKPIFDIYTSIAFQWYKKCFNARCFDPCNQILKFRESW
jgi:hypothetical protein